jgi:hypothetical protein
MRADRSNRNVRPLTGVEWLAPGRFRGVTTWPTEAMAEEAQVAEDAASSNSAAEMSESPQGHGEVFVTARKQIEGRSHTKVSPTRQWP